MQARPITVVDSGSSSGTGAGGQTIITGTPTVGSVQTVSCPCNPGTPGSLLISGTFVLTLVAEVSFDGGVTWNGTIMIPVGETTPVTSVTTPGSIFVDIEGATNVRARCTAFTSGTANVAFLPGTPPALPNAPILFVKPGTTRNDLTWRAIPGATGYNVYRGTAAGSETLLAGNQAGPTYANTSLTANTAYYYYVTTVSAVGESIASNEVVGLVVPAAPTSPAATGAASSIGLTWTAPTGGATTYNVYRGTATGAQNTTPLATGITAAAYTDSNVIFGTTYYYTVKAANTGGESVASTEVSASATGQPAPTSVAAVAGTGGIDVTWVAAAGAVTYNLYRGTAAGKQVAAPIKTGLTGTSTTDETGTAGVTYYYTMTALSTVGQSIKSNESSAVFPTLVEYVTENAAQPYVTENGLSSYIAE